MKLFTKHPHEVGETYFQHFRAAMHISSRHFLAAMFQAIHAAFPFVKPPIGTDVESMLLFLSSKQPSERKKESLDRPSRKSA